MPKYEIFLIKKIAVQKFVEAENHNHAEEIGYNLLADETFENPTDPDWDSYVYVDGEVQNA